MTHLERAQGRTLEGDLVTYWRYEVRDEKGNAVRMLIGSDNRVAVWGSFAFLTVLCAPHDPPACFTPKSEAHALGVNAALPIRKLLGFIAGKKLLELRDLVHAARDAAELAGGEGRSS